MTFPAWDTFEEDDRIRMRHLRVYRWCRKHLGFLTASEPKIETIADATSIDKSDVSRVLTDLVAWGYLIEGPRGTYGERSFILAWSRGEAVGKSPTTGAVVQRAVGT